MGDLTEAAMPGVHVEARCDLRQHVFECVQDGLEKITTLITIVKGKGKGRVLDIALLHDERMLRSTLQSRKWKL